MNSSTVEAISSPRLNAAAGDHDGGLSAFSEVRPRLFGIAYRMLGSAAAAEDIVQDVWLCRLGSPMIRGLWGHCKSFRLSALCELQSMGSFCLERK